MFEDRSIHSNTNVNNTRLVLLNINLLYAEVKERKQIIHWHPFNTAS